MIKAVIFDFGGVITSSCWDLDVMAQIIRDTLKENGILIPSDFNEKFRKVMLEAWDRVVKTLYEEPIHKHIKDALSRVGIQIDDALVEKIVDNIKEAPFCIVRPETKEVLEKLRDMGIKLCIVSNSPIRFHDRVLERNGLLEFFGDCIIVSCDVGYRKPDPRIFEIALKKLGVSPEEAIYIGDVPQIDIPGPKKLGMKVAIMEAPEPVMNYLPLPEDMDPPKADFIIKRLDEIIQIVSKYLET